MTTVTIERSLVESVANALRNEMTGEYGYVDLNLRVLVDRLEAALKENPVWDRSYNQEEKCVCGHPYYRHFDTYDDMLPVGCKYCACRIFQKIEYKHVCGASGFAIGRDGENDLCPACEVEAGRPPRWNRN